MAICPFADQKLIPPGANDPRITARAVVLHVDGSNASSLYTYFNGPSGGLESHFFVKQDGSVEQYRDTDWQADAAYESNDFAIQIESQGYGAGQWTDQQLDSIKRLIHWSHRHHRGIKLQEIDAHDGSGIGYHSQFDQWNLDHHSCPGPDRITQFNQVLVPWLRTLKENDVQLDDDIYRDTRTTTVRDLLQHLDRYLDNSANRDQQIKDMINQLSTAVDQEATKDELQQMLDNLKFVIEPSGGPTTS